MLLETALGNAPGALAGIFFTIAALVLLIQKLGFAEYFTNTGESLDKVTKALQENNQLLLEIKIHVEGLKKDFAEHEHDDERMLDKLDKKITDESNRLFDQIKGDHEKVADRLWDVLKERDSK